LRGFDEVQTLQVQPMTGTPVEVPLPSMVTRIDDMALGSVAVRTIRRRSCRVARGWKKFPTSKPVRGTGTRKRWYPLEPLTIRVVELATGRAGAGASIRFGRDNANLSPGVFHADGHQGRTAGRQKE
jgi:hypothetical protein